MWVGLGREGDFIPRVLVPIFLGRKKWIRKKPQVAT